MDSFYQISYRPVITVQRRAWTGGDVPPKDWYRDAHHRALAHAFFRDSISLLPFSRSILNLAAYRVYWNRARLDAWRTLKP